MVDALQSLDQEVVKLWHKDTNLQGCDFIVLPGGFSYGDYLRSGAIARFSPIMNEVIAYAHDGGLLMGICNGFQILVEAHLLPGVLLHNESRQFLCKNVHLRAVHTDSPFTAAADPAKAYKIPIAHGEGRYYADAATLEKMNDQGQILYRYCDEYGVISDSANPNGSLENIAGICNEGRTVFGMMPHPERAVFPLLNNTDGLVVFQSILQSVGVSL